MKKYERMFLSNLEISQEDVRKIVSFLDVSADTFGSCQLDDCSNYGKLYLYPSGMFKLSVCEKCYVEGQINDEMNLNLSLNKRRELVNIIVKYRERVLEMMEAYGL